MVTRTAGKGETHVVDGNRAASMAVRLCRPDIVSVFPITPQTPMIEDLCRYAAEGTMDADVIAPADRIRQVIRADGAVRRRLAPVSGNHVDQAA